MAAFAALVRTPLLPDEALICGLEDSARDEDGTLMQFPGTPTSGPDDDD